MRRKLTQSAFTSRYLYFNSREKIWARLKLWVRITRLDSYTTKKLFEDDVCVWTFESNWMRRARYREAAALWQLRFQAPKTLNFKIRPGKQTVCACDMILVVHIWELVCTSVCTCVSVGLYVCSDEVFAVWFIWWMAAKQTSAGAPKTHFSNSSSNHKAPVFTLVSSRGF